jgi:hypothetical protein
LRVARPLRPHRRRIRRPTRPRLPALPVRLPRRRARNSARVKSRVQPTTYRDLNSSSEAPYGPAAGTVRPAPLSTRVRSAAIRFDIRPARLCCSSRAGCREMAYLEMGSRPSRRPIRPGSEQMRSTRTIQNLPGSCPAREAGVTSGRSCLCRRAFMSWPKS